MRTLKNCYGRDSLAEKIVVSAKRNGAVLLFGGRQSGKTKVLLYLHKKLSELTADAAILSDIDIAVYVDLMVLAHDSEPSDFFSLLAAKAMTSCQSQIAGFQTDSNAANTFYSKSPESFIDRLTTIRRACGEVDIHLIFLLDESKRVLGDRFPRGFQDNLFTLLYGDAAPIGLRISIVFAGGQHLYKFSQDETSPIGSRAGYHFIENLDVTAVHNILNDAIPIMDEISAKKFSEEIFQATGGQAALTVKMILMLSECYSEAMQTKSIDQFKDLLIKENLGLFRNWTLAFSPEGKVIRDELALRGTLSISDVSSLLNQAGKDRFLAQRTFEELQYMGVATSERRLISRANQLFWSYAKEFDLVHEPIDPLEDASTWELIEKTELALREIIRLKYASRFGEKAEANIAAVLGEETWGKIEAMIRNSAKRYPFSREIAERDPFSCLYFGDLMTLIISNKIWPIFKSMFKDKRQIEDIVKAIIPVRNDSAHFTRIPEKELNRCRINCDDLLVILEKEISVMFNISIDAPQ